MSERDRAMEQGSTGLGEGGPRPRERKGAASPIYSVELEVFEGPLDLLLHLVRKHELDILDIPISFVAEKYLEYLDVMRQLDLEIAGDYLVMAATLAYLKSRELLPPEPRSREAGQSEEEEGEDPREALIRRLVEYERFKQAAAELDSLPVSGRDVFARGAELVMPPIDPGLAPVSLFNLAEAYYRVLTRAKVKSTHEVQIEAVTVAQRIKQLALILDEKPHFEFEELFLNRTWNSERELRAMLVVTLMSILEMVKLGVAGVQQPLDSTAIRIYRRASAQETQQALADYDEDASFGAPKPKEGESPAPSAPKRPSEAELDAIEEAALLAEALASVQEPEEPVGGYADEGEDVAANDPASEYDDEPRPAPRRSRSEGRVARADVLEDRDEALDDEADARLVIVEGTSAEVPREHDEPRWGRRAGGTGEEESAASATVESARGEDVLEDVTELREDAVVVAGDEASAAEDVLEGGTEAGEVAADASPEAEAPGVESVLEDMSAASDVAADAGAGDEVSGAEDVLEDMSAASEAADDAVAGEAPGGESVLEDMSAGSEFAADAEAGEALGAEDVLEDMSAASPELTSDSSEREGEAFAATADGEILDDALGDAGLRVGIAGDGSVGGGEGEGEDVREGASTDRREFEVPDGVARTGTPEGEPSERHDAVDEPESDGAVAGLEVDRDLADDDDAESDGEPERSASRRADVEGLDERVGAFSPAGGATGTPERQVDGDASSRGDARSSEVDAAAGLAGLPDEDVLENMSGAGEDGAAASPSTVPSGAAVESGEVEAAEASAATGDAHALEDSPAPERLEVSEPAEDRDFEAGLTAIGREAEPASSAERALEESRTADGAEASEPTSSAEERTFEASWTAEATEPMGSTGERALEDGRAAEGIEATEPMGSTGERALEDNWAADGLEATEPTVSARGEAEDVVEDDLTPGGAEVAESTAAAEDETEDVLAAGWSGRVVPANPPAAAEDAAAEDVLGDSSSANESEAAVRDEAAEDVLGDSSSANESEAAVRAEAAEGVLGDSSSANGSEAAVRVEGAEDVLGDSLASGGLAASPAAGGDGAAEEALEEELAGAERDAESERSTQALADPEGGDVPKDSLASGENAVEPAASDAEDDASKPVRSDSDEDEAGGLFLNTGEGLGARELGDVDEDEGDAQ